MSRIVAVVVGMAGSSSAGANRSKQGSVWWHMAVEQAEEVAVVVAQNGWHQNCLYKMSGSVQTMRCFVVFNARKCSGARWGC